MAPGFSSTTAVAGVCIVVLIVVVFWGVSKLSLQEQNCATIAASYMAFPKINSFNPSDPEYSHNLRDYYISAAYDVCTAGLYKNDFVNLCALRSAIKQGVRCLDFAVYTVNYEPVVACSSLSEYTVKESYNSIPFGSVLSTINSHAFSNSLCPNPMDPLILHIRLMSSLASTSNKIAQQLQSGVGTRLLGPKYSFQYQGNNFGTTPLAALRGKIVIIVDQSNASFLDTQLEEYVNIASNAPFMRVLRFTDGVSQCGDKEELLEYNKKNMSIVLPDRAIGVQNYSTPEAEALGCQFSALAFQVKDAEVQYDISAFESRGSSFRLRPAAQRWIPIQVPLPPLPPASQSYASRPINGLAIANLKLDI